MDVEQIVEDLAAALRAVAVPADAEPMARYMKDQFTFLGVKAPARRSAARPIVTELRGADAETLFGFAAACWRREREFQYVGCDVLAANHASFDAGHVGSVAELVQSRSWWDTVDALAPNVLGKIALGHRPAWSMIDAWIDGDDMWLARSSILQQLKYGADTDQDVLFDRCLRRADDPDFFIRKAIGWALRQHARQAPDDVQRFVRDHVDVLAPLSVREATKHLARH